jgi:hypothetical protein
MSSSSSPNSMFVSCNYYQILNELTVAIENKKLADSKLDQNANNRINFLKTSEEAKIILQKLEDLVQDPTSIQFYLTNEVSQFEY